MRRHFTVGEIVLYSNTQMVKNLVIHPMMTDFVTSGATMRVSEMLASMTLQILPVLW